MLVLVLDAPLNVAYLHLKILGNVKSPFAGSTIHKGNVLMK